MNKKEIFSTITDLRIDLANIGQDKIGGKLAEFEIDIFKYLDQFEASIIEECAKVADEFLITTATHDVHNRIQHENEKVNAISKEIRKLKEKL